MAGALLLLADRSEAAVVAAAVGLVMLVVALVRPWIIGSIQHVLQRFSARLATLVAAVVAIIIWPFTVLPIWIVTSLIHSRWFRQEPTDTQSGWLLVPTDRLRDVRGATVNQHRAGTRVERVPGRPLSNAARRVLVMSGLSLVAMAGVLATGGRAASQSSVPPFASPMNPNPPPMRATGRLVSEYLGLPIDNWGHRSEPWARAYFGELEDHVDRSDLILGAVPINFRGKYLNIEDHLRVSWEPPEHQMTIWFFGGSTMFGVGQRDDHTIPSVVARLAADDGLRIRVVNFGVPAYVNWSETERLEQHLSLGGEVPDLVVFYDGANELALSGARVQMGDAEPSAVRRLGFSEEEREQLRQTAGSSPSLAGEPFSDTLRVDLAAMQYRRGVQLARRLGQAYGFPVVHFWQPIAVAQAGARSNLELWKRLDFNPRYVENEAEIYHRTRSKSDVEPIDISDALDDAPRDTFLDWAHTNELGARLVASAMYERLRPRLDELSRQRR